MGNLLFYQKGTTKQFPYLTRQVPKSWRTNGTFQTKGKGDLQLKFFQYSNSKWVKIQPDVVEYGKGSVEKPMFDLILGTQTMDELGIILDFKNKMITIDEMKLPITSPFICFCWLKSVMDIAANDVACVVCNGSTIEVIFWGGRSLPFF